MQRVVQSYRRNVMVGKLKDIKFDALREEAGPINDLFDKCCQILDAHKQPLESLNVRAKLEELEEDWEWLKNTRKKFT